MASFGSFETDREIYSDSIYTVYGATKSGDPKSEYAVKVFSLERVGFDEETATELKPLVNDIERARVEGIGVQAQAAATSKCIAPVLETGRDERGVWYVTRFYPRSVNKIISGKVALSREALYHIIHSIARGALDFKRACGRSHGDIRPSNVQISKSERLREAEVVISDPLPGSADEAARYEISDLRAVGRILLQLVRQRAIGDEEDFLILPILSTPEWTRLFGKDADAWLALCNRLLDPNLSLEQFTLEQLVAWLDQRQPKSGISPKLVIAVAAGVACIGLVAFLILRPRSRTIEVTSDPPGATILLDKAEQAGKTPLTLKLKNGSYTIEARHTELRLLERSTNWVVQSGSPTKLHFQFAFGSVAIKSDPPGATIKRDGEEIGKTPFVIPVVASGIEVKYELSLAEHVTKPIRGVVTNGQKLELSETLPLVRDVGTLDLDSTPRGAKVFLKEKLVASATPEQVRLEQGAYTLTAVYRDWPPKELAVEVKRGVVVPVNFYFENGRVSLDSSPSGAAVWLGTNQIGTTPLTVVRPVGRTTFRFELPGFEGTNETVTVADKATVSVKAAMLTTNGVFELGADPAVAWQLFDTNGKEINRTTAGKPLTLTVAPGNYSFVARTEGLGDATATLKVEKRELKKHTFVFDYGTVRLDSMPPGAAISSDGKVLGFAPKTFVQKPGTKVTYLIAAPDYLSATNEVTVQSGERDKPVIVRLLPEPVSVAFTSDPPGAQFYFGAAALVENRATFAMPWGTNVVTAKHALYPWLEEVTDTIIARKGSANPHEFKFNYGTVGFETTPTDANAGIFERGKLVGHTPTNLFIRPGRVDYELIYEDQTNRVGTNVLRSALYRFVSAFELRRDYTNNIGMVLVRVKDGIYVSKFEVTQEEYHRVMGGAVEGNKPRQPVVNVNWANAQAFCQKLSQMDTESAAKAHIGGAVYALPTDAEWARFAEADPAQLTEAVFDSRLQEPMDVNPLRKSSNRAGLYDLFGNVAEWCVGANQQPITIGGGYNNRKPAQIPESLMRFTDARLLESSVKDGSPNIGFRCVIRSSRP